MQLGLPSDWCRRIELGEEAGLTSVSNSDSGDGFPRGRVLGVFGEKFFEHCDGFVDLAGGREHSCHLCGGLHFGFLGCFGFGFRSGCRFSFRFGFGSGLNLSLGDFFDLFASSACTQQEQGGDEHPIRTHAQLHDLASRSEILPCICLGFWIGLWALRDALG